MNRSRVPASPNRFSRLLRGLGWLSVGLGAGPLLRPAAVAAASGVDLKPQNLVLLRIVGIRELLVAAGLLFGSGSAWAWARVAQDAMDVPLAIRSVAGKRGQQRQRAQTTLAVLLAIAAVDLGAAYEAAARRRRSRAVGGQHDRKETGVSAFSAVTISRSQDEIAARVAQAEPPLSDEGAEISYATAPGGRGTEVRVRLTRPVPGGGVGQQVAAVLGTDPQRQLDDALRRFKQVLETGEVIRSEGSPSGTDAKQQRSQEPAAPAPTA
jgi:hypothetical protein